MDDHRAVLSVSAAGTPTIEWIKFDNPVPKIMLLESYRLTSFLGDYGAGKTVQTFTLLPGEKTRISIKTWKTTETTAKEARSLLDSWSRDTSDTFEVTLQNETSNREQLTESYEWYLKGGGKFHGGVNIEVINAGAEYSVEGGTKGSTNSVRENLRKNVYNASQKHIANASSKRNIEVNTTFENRVTIGEEQLIEREPENVNVGRVLNFVFRQLNQEYSKYLHLVDVKLAISNGEVADLLVYKEGTLTGIEDFLKTYLVESDPTDPSILPREIIRKMIVEELTSIMDYKGAIKEFIECVHISSAQTRNIYDYLDESLRLNNGVLQLYIRKKNTPFIKIRILKVSIMKKEKLKE